MASLKEIRKQYPEYAEKSDGDLLMAIRRTHYPEMHPRTFFDSIDGASNASGTISRGVLRDEYRRDVAAPLPGETKDQTSRRLYGSSDGPVGNSGGKVTSALRSLFQGMTFGLGDEIAAGGASVLGPNTYEQELTAERDRLAIGREQNPIAATGAEVAGAFAMPGAALARGRSLASNSLKSAGLAGLGGAFYGFNAGEGGAHDRAKNAATTGGLAAALGGAAPSATNVLSKPIQKFLTKRATSKALQDAPDSDDLRRLAGEKFEAAGKVEIPRQSFTDQAASIEAAAKSAGMRRKSLTPKSAAVLREILDEATSPNPSMTVGDIQDLRKITSAATGNFSNPFDQKVGIAIRGGIDTAMENIDGASAGQIKEANKMWQTLKKSEKLDEIFARSQLQASGFENGLRINFRAILKSPKQRKQFTKVEIAAMEEVVKGSVVGNAMKKIGKLGFGRGQQSNVLSGTAGAMAFGPAATLAGQGALKASESITARNAAKLQDLVLLGGLPDAPQITNQTKGLMDSLMRRQGRAIPQMNQ